MLQIIEDDFVLVGGSTMTTSWMIDSDFVRNNVNNTEGCCYRDCGKIHGKLHGYAVVGFLDDHSDLETCHFEEISQTLWGAQRELDRIADIIKFW